MHCLLELALKDSQKKEPIFDKMNTLLSGLYYFYHNSPLNRANLPIKSLSVDGLYLGCTNIVHFTLGIYVFKKDNAILSDGLSNGEHLFFHV